MANGVKVLFKLRIVGIKCDFDNSSPLYILSVYLPTSSRKDIDFLQYFNHLWALYDSPSVQCYVILIGDFNGVLGNSLSVGLEMSEEEKNLPYLYWTPKLHKVNSKIAL